MDWLRGVDIDVHSGGFRDFLDYLVEKHKIEIQKNTAVNDENKTKKTRSRKRKTPRKVSQKLFSEASEPTPHD